ncbi:MAG: MinD/ParA family protein [Deltaproteobacteria bacterium]|nr:MinD/ParA family protein [Deltaproteobacteria bacterium]
MNQDLKRNNLIVLSDRIAARKGEKGRKTEKTRKPDTRIISITSGKGGVGKSNIVANVGFVLSRLGKRVLILDADLGLGNLDVLLGLTPKYNLSHAVLGTRTISEITLEGPGKIMILPASSGVQEMADLTDEQKAKFLSSLDSVMDDVDVLLIDTGAGISSNVMYFNSNAREILVVVTPEPTSITDAYALMKLLSLNYSQSRFKLVVNFANSSREAEDVYQQIKLVADRFLNITIEYMGFVLVDQRVKEGVRRQKIVSEMKPEAAASRCFVSLAKALLNTPPPDLSGKHSRSYWRDLFESAP